MKFDNFATATSVVQHNDNLLRPSPDYHTEHLPLCDEAGCASVAE